MIYKIHILFTKWYVLVNEICELGMTINFLIYIYIQHFIIAYNNNTRTSKDSSSSNSTDTWDTWKVTDVFILL